MLTLLAFAFSWIGIGLLGTALIAGAVICFMRGWTNAALWLGIAAAVHIYSGTIYRAGVNAERTRTVAEIAKEQTRQKRATSEAIDALQKQLAEAEAGEADAEATATALQALITSRPPVAGRGATQEDVDALSR